ncbi:MAG: GntR family transcriptional regulator [Acidimicrobiales bacterium]
MTVERKGALPLWGQVLEDLRVRLDSGDFADRFPGDMDLVDQYQVSRHTVREAVRHLQVEGLLERRRGKGSYITTNRIEQPLGTLYSLFRSVEARGLVQESVVRFLEERRDDAAATILGYGSDEPLVYLERVRFADRQPIALDCSWLPSRVARSLLDVDFRHTALYEELADRCGIRLDTGWERIRPVFPDRSQRELLRVGAREAAFAIERVAFAEGRPVEWRHSVVRGDRFSFVARWSAEKLDTSFEATDQIR